jgi:hypothetical protein
VLGAQGHDRPRVACGGWGNRGVVLKALSPLDPGRLLVWARVCAHRVSCPHLACTAHALRLADRVHRRPGAQWPLLSHGCCISGQCQSPRHELPTSHPTAVPGEASVVAGPVVRRAAGEHASTRAHSFLALLTSAWGVGGAPQSHSHPMHARKLTAAVPTHCPLVPVPKRRYPIATTCARPCARWPTPCRVATSA